MAIDSTTIIAAIFSVVQQLNQAMPLWFQQGGLIMWLLLLTSFLTTVVTLERCFVWLHYYFKKEHLPLLDCFAYLNKKEKTNAHLVSMLCHFRPITKWNPTQNGKYTICPAGKLYSIP
jgi:hypothetical protein